MAQGNIVDAGDVLIVGAGLAGLFTALKLAPRPVTVLAGAPIGDGASSTWAQGGIAAAIEPGDTPESHAADTITAGAGTVDEERLAALEADRPGNRSNDGRADAFGGFWIGTMERDGRAGKGAIYRYLDGELRLLRGNMSIPNAICFSPDGRLAYFADTAAQTVWSQDLDARGWPCADARVFLDLAGTDQFPDGAVTDAQGRFWNARWGSGAVACHAPDGRLLRRLSLPASQPSCPAFGGPGLAQLIVTSAAEGRHGPQDGRTWLLDPDAQGRPEPRVRA